MKKIIFLIFIALGLSLLLSYAIQLDSGYVRISYDNWLAESNLWVFLGLNLALLAAILIILSIFKGTAHLGKKLSRGFGKSSEEKAKDATEKGIIAFLEGNWVHSKKLLIRAARKNTNPIINYLAAAQACNELGQTKEAEQFC